MLLEVKKIKIIVPPGQTIILHDISWDEPQAVIAKVLIT